MSPINVAALQRGESILIQTKNEDPEEWRLISYPEFKLSTYDQSIQFASSLGNLMRYNTEIITPETCYVDPDGYLRVGVGSKSTLVHRIICYTFHGPPPTEFHTVDHSNRVRTDNRACNLQWADQVEQLNNRTRTDSEGKEIPYKKVNHVKLYAHVKLPRNLTKHVKVYTRYVTSELDIEQVAAEYAIAPSTTRGYVGRNFDPDQHSDVVCRKLGITRDIILEAYTVMTACQSITHNNKEKASHLYTEDIYATLSTCTDKPLATQLLRRLYQHYYTPNQRPSGDERVTILEPE